MGSYLGIPESLGGSKIQVFGFVQERLNNRVNGWTFKFFTKGGKEVIIKSVVTALPNHVMSCYRIPKTVRADECSGTVLVESRGGGILVVCIGNHGINSVPLRMKEGWVLKISQISIQQCWGNNYGG